MCAQGGVERKLEETNVSMQRHPGSPRTAMNLPRATTALLLGVGALLALSTFLVVSNMPDLPWHPARDAELRATYDAYQDTGVLLVKEAGTGSWYGQIQEEGYSRAAGDDDPGSYLVALLLGELTGSDSPYPGLRLAMALLVSLPLVVLPLMVAGVFRRARAGYAMLVLPVVTWLVNHGTVLVGTEYGLSDEVSVTRVYALYGLAASMAFASLVVLSFLVTRRLGIRWLVVASLLVVVMAASGNLLRSMSGVGIALSLGLVWWVQLRDRRGRLARTAVSAGVGLGAVLLSVLAPSTVMSAIDESRGTLVAASESELPTSHGVWHPLYLGLSYPQPINGQPSPFGVTWSDEFGWAKAREVDPEVRIASVEYDQIIKDLYLDAVQTDLTGAVRLYLGKALFTIKHFAAMIVLILLGFGLAWSRPGPHRRHLANVLLVSAPTLALGLLPVVAVMPMLYYFSELSAVLGLLTAVALGGLVWAYSSLPSHVRAGERSRLAQQIHREQRAPSHRLSVVVPSRNGGDVLPDTLERLGRRLTARDQVIVVENGSTDNTEQVLLQIRDAWPHACELVAMRSTAGLGNALRAGVLAATGERLLLTADDLPFDFTDLDAFEALEVQPVVAIGSKAHPDSVVRRSGRRTLQSAVFRSLREALLHSTVGDSQGTIWVDGRWARMFASLSRETGLMWTVELVLAAEQQGLDVVEVPVRLRESHDAVTSRFSLKDAVVGVRELGRLALQKDEYAQDDWPTPGNALASATARSRAAAPRVAHDVPGHHG